MKDLPAMQETQVRSLGWEDPLEKRMTMHSSILTRRTPWTEGPSGLQSTGSQSQRQLNEFERERRQLYNGRTIHSILQVRKLRAEVK